MRLNFTASDDYPIRPYVVELADLYDEDERHLIRLYAIGEADVRSQVKANHPGYFIKGMDPQCTCGHKMHAGRCKGGASTSEGTYRWCGCPG